MADVKNVGPPAPPAPDPNPKTVDELKRVGEQKYQTICANCHGPTGQGVLQDGGELAQLRRAGRPRPIRKLALDHE